MTISIDAALAAVNAYQGTSLTLEEVNDEMVMDLLTDLENLARAAGIEYRDYQAHVNHLCEQGLCWDCASNPESEDWDWKFCPGHYNGFHQFDDIDDASRKWIDAGLAAGVKVRRHDGTFYEKEEES